MKNLGPRRIVKDEVSPKIWVDGDADHLFECRIAFDERVILTIELPLLRIDPCEGPSMEIIGYGDAAFRREGDESGGFKICAERSLELVRNCIDDCDPAFARLGHKEL